MIIEQYRKGKTPTEIMSEYGLGKTALYKWVNERKEITVEQESLTAVDSKKFKAHIRELEEENSILKKVLILFAKK